MAQNDNTGMVKGLLIGAIAGGLVGAVLALLYAPKSGRELRAEIKDKADTLLDGADEYLRSAKEQAGQMMSTAKVRSEQLIDDAKKKADSLLVDADRVLTGARQKAGTVSEEASRVKSAVKSGIDAYKEERRKG